MAKRASTTLTLHDDTFEREASRRNRRLRERYTEVSEQLERPDVDVRRLTAILKHIGNEFIEANAALAASLVSRVAGPLGTNPSVDYGELYQVALVSMWDYFLTWDPDLGNYTTHSFVAVQSVIRHEMVRGRNEGSYGDHRARAAALSAFTELKAKLGHNPSIEEVAAAAGLTVDTARRVLRPPSLSIDRPAEPGSSTTLADVIVDPRQDVAVASGDVWFAQLARALRGPQRRCPYAADCQHDVDIAHSRACPHGRTCRDGESCADRDIPTMQEILITLRRNGYDGWPAAILQNVGAWLGIGREPARRAEGSALAKFERNGTPLPEPE